MRMFGEKSATRLGFGCILVYFQACLVLSSSHRINRRATHSKQFYDGGELQESAPLSNFDNPSLSEVLGQDATNPGHLLPHPIPLSDLLLPSGPELLAPQPPIRNTFHVVDECVKITLDEGVYHFKSRGGSPQVCGLFFASDPDKNIVIHVDYLDAKCEDNGLISVVDGWELNGQVFPSALDHHLDLTSRFHDLCLDSSGRKRISRSFTSSQNVALIQYRVPGYGQGFSVRVKHVPNPTPCNILVQDLEGIYKLENFGRNTNCSLTTMFDAKIRFLYVSVGEQETGGSPTFSGRRTVSSPLYHKCEKLGLQDYTQIGGSSGLDTARMELIDEFCGHQAHPRSDYSTVFCGMTTIRLVSSGKFVNKLLAEVRRAELEDLESANYICDDPGV